MLNTLKIIGKMEEYIGLGKRINFENGENAKDAPDFNRVWSRASQPNQPEG
jgi:hypothetical protein